MTRKQQRLYMVVAGMMMLGLATALGLAALRDNLVFFYSPMDLQTRDTSAIPRFRLGGLVKEGSLVRDGQQVRFVVTDGVADVAVHYRGILPDLFREGQGVVTEGRLDSGGTFVASEVLAKHDETYMPAEVVESLKKSGHWTGQQTGGDPGRP
ncbi:cytochrome c maturation protein CcmE [Haematospirillum jordaniae]|uniref:Cytochrome c-type biogenesis protein CcmE n=1 Tax=Haematospirillum jordaniae TaxID=1549855 RepID=A0A143DCP3_9PROT|nr:cytochrome c maturation protein CcmE [Haematospirillum jordaniae]AMW34369.1 cytochrome c biogenesis protein CcmE [Haematospirillum jordaniae]NKD44661.1 cytochrome c maturation protein CcmE [Haematospirillum jordaniae]NKD57681.1 cytochrome c maturation protein CcmE [Haematospirillum jordaniae]NKD59251.1 cytochrome c maturation protein CcmE [Haematospirillum jordaniae]NKD67389.1 cytochrome c maturation protein CcmE [Haematospirillum jordaniae]